MTEDMWDGLTALGWLANLITCLAGLAFGIALGVQYMRGGLW